MQPEGSLPHSQEPTTCPCPELGLYRSVSLVSRPLCIIRNVFKFLRWRVVSTSPNPQSGESFLVGCPRLIIFAATLHICRLFLHPHSEDTPYRCDRDTLITETEVIKVLTVRFILCVCKQNERMRYGKKEEGSKWRGEGNRWKQEDR
jgi:hypothetical protein